MAKWIYELILEKLPPFRWVPVGYRVLVQLLVVEVIGTSLAVLFSLPIYSILLGSLAVLVISVWSFLIYNIGLTIHRLQSPSAPLEKKVIEDYQESLFSPRHYELFLGVALLCILALYFFVVDQSLIKFWLGGKLSVAPLILVGLVLWDLSYRLGVGLWSALIAFRRSRNFVKVSGMRTKMSYTAYRELRTLRRMDSINLLFGMVTLLLYPIFRFDIPLFVGLIVYSCAILGFSAASLFAMSSIPGLPGEVLWLLGEGKVAYVGTSDKKMQPHLTPVIFVFVGHKLYFITSKISKKLKNVRENRKTAVLIDIRDENNLYNNRAVLFMGKAKVYNPWNAIWGLITLLKVRRAFFKKYPEYMHEYQKEKQNLPLAWRTTIFVSRIPVRVEPEKIVYWREAKAIKLPLGV
jgi:nitroimidazol reductase NimA-like FMN-containing flavoprotein (pyridoxamine 5'-phosphate oxidase superfamily)